MTESFNQAGEPCQEGSDAFVRELEQLHKPGFSVPPEVDRAVLGLARQQLGVRNRRRLLFRVAAVTTAAAAITFAFFPWDTDQPVSPPAENAQFVALPEDVDRNGRVDILDAFTLARNIEADRASNQHDLNTDGVVNQADVDTIALAAVSLKGSLVQ